VKNHRNTETDDADQHDGENDDPGNGGARRDERSRQCQCEKTDEEASRRHKKRFLELDAAVSNRERIKQKVHRTPVDDLLGTAIEQVNDDRNGNRKSSDHERCIKKQQGSGLSLGEVGE